MAHVYFIIEEKRREESCGFLFFRWLTIDVRRTCTHFDCSKNRQNWITPDTTLSTIPEHDECSYSRETDSRISLCAWATKEKKMEKDKFSLQRIGECLFLFFPLISSKCVATETMTTMNVNALELVICSKFRFILNYWKISFWIMNPQHARTFTTVPFDMITFGAMNRQSH